MHFSENAKNNSVGAAVPNDGYVNFEDNLKFVVSRTGLNVIKTTFYEPNGIFSISMDNNAVQLGDTVKLDLNQFEDRNGINLSGILVLTYSETPDTLGFANGWISSIENN